jgi:hypothetical protein
LLSALLALLLGCSSQAMHKLELTQLFPRARTRSIVTGNGPLGGKQYQAFRAAGLVTSDDQWVSSPDGKVDLRFYLHRLQPLRLTLEVEGEGEVSPSLNGAALEKQVLPKGLGVLDIEVAIDPVRLGLNRLTLTAAPEVRWRALLVEPAFAAISSKTGQVARPFVDGANLLLPFGQTLSLPLPPQGASRLSFGLETWKEEGVAALADGSWSLLVSTREDDPATLLALEIDEVGRQDLSLPALKHAAVLELSLQPKDDRGPLPGQLGVRLVAPILEMESAPAAPSTADPGEPEFVGEDSVSVGALKFMARPPALYDLAKDPEQQKDLMLVRPATALHLESVLLERRQGGDQGRATDEETLRNLRTLEYLR